MRAMFVPVKLPLSVFTLDPPRRVRPPSHNARIKNTTPFLTTCFEENILAVTFISRRSTTRITGTLILLAVDVRRS